MRIPTGLFVLALCCAPAYGAGNTGSMASDADTLAREAIEGAIAEAVAEAVPLAPEHLQPCVGGTAAGVYPCSNIDLLEFMPVATFGATATNSGWGWTDTLTGHEY